MLCKKQRVILFSKKKIALVREGGFGRKNYDGELG